MDSALLLSTLPDWIDHANAVNHLYFDRACRALGLYTLYDVTTAPDQFPRAR